MADQTPKQIAERIRTATSRLAKYAHCDSAISKTIYELDAIATDAEDTEPPSTATPESSWLALPSGSGIDMSRVTMIQNSAEMVQIHYAVGEGYWTFRFEDADAIRAWLQAKTGGAA